MKRKKLLCTMLAGLMAVSMILPVSAEELPAVPEVVATEKITAEEVGDIQSVSVFPEGIDEELVGEMEEDELVGAPSFDLVTAQSSAAPANILGPVTDTFASTGAGVYYAKYYKFTSAAENVSYKLTFTNSSDKAGYYMHIYSDTGVLVSKLGSVGKNASLYTTIKLEPNKQYYAFVYCSNANVGGTVSFSSIATPDEPDTMDTARAAMPGDQISGTICVPVNSSSTNNYLRSGYSDEDWYKFTATTTSNNFTVYNADVPTYLSFEITDDAGVIISKERPYKNSKQTITASTVPGKTYYIHVFHTSSSSNSVGSYTIDFVAESEASNTKELAQTITADTLYKDAINAKGDVDYFKLHTSAECVYYTFEVNNISYPHGNGVSFEIVTADGAVIDGSKTAVTSMGKQNIVVTKLPTDKDLYVLIHGYANGDQIGDYSFKYSVKSDAADSIGTAGLISAGKDYSGFIAGKLDEDWYKFVTTDRDAKYIFKINNLEDFASYLDVITADGTRVNGTSSYSNKTETVEMSLPANAIYYVKIHTNSIDRYGNYTFNYMVEYKFSDDADGAWYGEALQYVANNGIMTGYKGTTKFGVNDSIRREDFATMLWRMEGEPAVAFSGKFSDVSRGKYYSDAVEWCASTGIVTGYKGTTKFGRGDSITREQLAAMLYRYASYKGKDTSASTNLNTFPDYSAVHSYATTPFSWCVAKGIITGKQKSGNYYLSPTGSATRAECATMVMRFLKNI